MRPGKTSRLCGVGVDDKPGGLPTEIADPAPAPAQVCITIRCAFNWRAEQALRPAIVTRKMCGGGNRSPRGADTQHVLASMLRTARQRGLDETDVLVTLLRAPMPIVSPHFYPTGVSVN